MKRNWFIVAVVSFLGTWLWVSRASTLAGVSQVPLALEEKQQSNPAPVNTLYAVSNKKEADVITRDLASPVFFALDKKGNPRLILLSDLIFTLRSDGSVGWRAEKTKKIEEQPEDPMLPKIDYNSGKSR